MSSASTPIRLISWLAPGIDATVFELAAATIEATLQRPVDLQLITHCSGPSPHDNPLAEGTAELGWMCSTAYVQLPGVELVGVSWAPIDPDLDGQALYFSDLVAHHDSPIDGVDALLGRDVGCNDPVSLSGHYALRFALDDRGLDLETHADVHFTGGHLASLQALAGREVDAAVVDSITRRALCPDVKVIERLGPWPTQPLVCGATFPKADRTLISEALADGLGSHPVLVAAGLERFVAVNDTHYAPVRARFASG